MGSTIWRKGNETSIDYEEGRFSVSAPGFYSTKIDVYDLVVFFKEAFDPVLMNEIAFREKTVVKTIKTRTTFIPKGFLYNFGDFLNEYITDDDGNIEENWSYKTGKDDWALVSDYLNQDRKEFITSVKQKGLMHTISTWLNKYKEYPLVGHIMDTVVISHYITVKGKR